MAVKIEMEMPKGCDRCRFGIAYKGDNTSVWCSASQMLVTGAKLIDGKLERCPLKECL